jgi:hypothetical protein
MRCVALLGALLLLLAGKASAQIQVTAQTERTDFLLYERVDLIVSIVNMGESDLELNNNEGQPWLSFLVVKKDGLPVRSERSSNFAGLTLKVGERKTLRVNLTPLFSFRELGEYKATVVIDLPGAGQVLSDAVPFHVVDGRVVVHEDHVSNGDQRTYSLIRFSPTPDRTNLYLRVESAEENVVYTNISLGEMSSSIYFDPLGNVHVLQPVAMGTYLYTRTDPTGKVLIQRIFKTSQEVPPRLAKLPDGNVTVLGGLEQNPDEERDRLSDTQDGTGAPAPADGAPDAASTPAK